MTTKAIVSYDGTDSDQDALALGRVLRSAGATLELAYVRHLRERGRGSEETAQREARELLQSGAAWLEQPDIARYVVFSASTPEGLAELARSERADAIVFGSEYRTAPEHVQPQASALRLLEGGALAVAIAPAGLHARRLEVGKIAAVGEDEDPAANETATSLAAALGATLVERGADRAELLVVGSKPGTAEGRVGVSALTQYLIETVRCPVLVVPRGRALLFGA